MRSVCSLQSLTKGACLQRNALVALAGALSTLVTALLALSSAHRPSGSEDAACALSGSQIAAIQGVVRTFSNSTCAYNISLDSILDMEV